MNHTLNKLGFLTIASIAAIGLTACAPSGTNHLQRAGGHLSMSMDDMMEELEGKTGDDFDKAFIEMMIPHHEGAIAMARAGQKSAKHQEIKDMADDIISAQQSEIDMMRGWQREWGYTQ